MNKVKIKDPPLAERGIFTDLDLIVTSNLEYICNQLQSPILLLRVEHRRR